MATRYIANDGTSWNSENEAINRNTLMANREYAFNEAGRMENQGDYSAAVNLYTQVINMHGDYAYNTVPYARRGQANYNGKQYAAAVSDFRTALRGNIYVNKLSVESKKAICNMIGASYENSGDDDGAICEYAKGYSLYSDSDDLKNNFFRLQEKMAKVLSAYDGLGAQELFTKANEFSEDKKYYSAFKLYLKAAEMGHSGAQNNAGYCYDAGEGVPENGYKAVEWYKKSAAQKNSYGVRSMGIAYENGRGGLKRNLHKALGWYKKAKKLGNPNAEGDIRDVKAKIKEETRERIREKGSPAFAIVDSGSGQGSTFIFGAIGAGIGVFIGTLIGGWIAMGIGAIVGWVFISKLIGERVYVNLLSIILGIVCGSLVALLAGWAGNGLRPDLAPLIARILFIPFMIAGTIFFLIARARDNKILLAMLIVLAIGGGYALTEPPFPFNLAQNSTNAAAATAAVTRNVNFRKGPSTNDEVIRLLPQGDTVTLTGEVSGGWTQITHNGDTGWISSEFLSGEQLR